MDLVLNEATGLMSELAHQAAQVTSLQQFAGKLSLLHYDSRPHFLSPLVASSLNLFLLSLAAWT